MPKLTDAAITKATALSANDRLYIVDVSDTTHDPAGTSKYIEVADLRKIPPQSVSFTRTSGQISQITLADSTEINITRDGDGLISSIENGTYQWDLTRNGSNQITDITVSQL